MRRLAYGTLACALALAIGLTGCGGNSSQTEDKASNEETAQQEEPAFNAEDFFGCWEYVEYDMWLYVYGDGTYEWFYDDGSSVTGDYEISGDGELSIEGSELTFVLNDDGGMLDSDGDALFPSELPDFDEVPGPEDGGGDHESSGRDYETFAGTSWLCSPETYAFNDDGTIDVYDESDHSLIGYGEYYWRDDLGIGQVYLETPEFDEVVMDLYFDGDGDLVFDEGDDGWSYYPQQL